MSEFGKLMKNFNECIAPDIKKREFCFEKPKISVIVPAYNVEKYIERCLTFLCNQTLDEIEIIVINDGSIDRTEDIVSVFLKFDSRIKLISQSNQKQGAARNRGLEIAKGEYISFVDADDWVSIDYFEKLYLAIKKYNADVAAASIVRETRGRIRNINLYKDFKFYDNKDEICRLMTKKTLGATTFLIKSELIKDLRFEENVFYEDPGYLIRMLLKINTLVCVPDIYYYYFSNPKSTMKSKHNIAKTIDKINAALDFIKIAHDNKLNVKCGPVLKEDRFFYKIKHYKEKKEYYLFGIKLFEKKIKFDDNKTFLIFNTACFGDVLLCNSLIQNIKLIYPSSKVIFIVDKPFFEAAKYQKGVDEVVVFDKKGKHKGIFGLFKFIKEFEFKNAFVSIVTYKNERNRLISKLLGAKFIVEAKKCDNKTKMQFAILNLLKEITNKPLKNLPLIYETEDDIPLKFKDLISKNKKYITLCTLTKQKYKDMPEDTAIELIKKINQTDYKVIFTGKGDLAKEYSKKLKEAGCNFIDLQNQTTILELAKVIKNSKCLISVDTGTMHLGYSSSIPVVAVFYEQNVSQIWAPDEKLYKSILIEDNQTADRIFEAMKEIKND